MSRSHMCRGGNSGLRVARDLEWGAARAEGRVRAGLGEAGHLVRGLRLLLLRVFHLGDALAEDDAEGPRLLHERAIPAPDGRARAGGPGAGAERAAAAAAVVVAAYLCGEGREAKADQHGLVLRDADGPLALVIGEALRG